MRDAPKIHRGGLLLVALAIALLINANRLLSILIPRFAYFNDIEGASIPIFIFRTMAFAGLCYLISYIAVTDPKSFLGLKNWMRQFVFFIIISIAAIISFYLFDWLHGLWFYDIVNPEKKGIKYVWIVMTVTAILAGWVFKFQAKKGFLKIQQEQLLKAKAENELAALNNQINPHFLFNSLNTLKHIIQDPSLDPIPFVDRLAILYRYILQSSEKGLVSLQEELDFLDNYIYLIKTRFGDNFDVQIQLQLDRKQTMIPVLALQLLVENAIKHNEITKEFPLLVHIYEEADNIVIKNRIRTKKLLKNSTRKGLNNLSRRYKLLKNKTIIIDHAEDFKVILPLD